MNEIDRKMELRKFLLDRRGRLKPTDVGLPDRGGRRCPGLRREEVADLAGVSVTWYTLFEMARRTSSMRMVDRVAQALLLGDEDRSTLLRLAIPEVARAWKVYEDQSTVSRLQLLELVRDFALALAESQSEEEAVDATMRWMLDILGPLVGAEEVRVGQHNLVQRRRLFTSCPLVVDAEILAVASELRDGGEPYDSNDGIACIPVRARGRLHSIIFIAGGPSRTYPPEQLRLMATLAALLGGQLGARRVNRILEQHDRACHRFAHWGRYRLRGWNLCGGRCSDRDSAIESRRPREQEPSAGHRDGDSR